MAEVIAKYRPKVYMCFDANCLCFMNGIISEDEWNADSNKAVYYCTVNNKNDEKIDDFVIHKDDLECLRSLENFDAKAMSQAIKTPSFDKEVDDFVDNYLKQYN